MSEKHLYALRGAAQCLNDAEDITRQVALLYDELLAKNRLSGQDIVSIIFSLTKDISALNPAAALRGSGRGEDLAMMVTQEADLPGMLERVIRVLVHCYLDEGVSPRHVYRNGAEALRPDRAEG